jgi:hypothetical protein
MEEKVVLEGKAGEDDTTQSTRCLVHKGDLSATAGRRIRGRTETAGGFQVLLARNRFQVYLTVASAACLELLG